MSEVTAAAVEVLAEELRDVWLKNCPVVLWKEIRPQLQEDWRRVARHVLTVRSPPSPDTKQLREALEEYACPGRGACPAPWDSHGCSLGDGCGLIAADALALEIPCSDTAPPTAKIHPRATLTEAQKRWPPLTQAAQAAAYDQIAHGANAILSGATAEGDFWVDLRNHCGSAVCALAVGVAGGGS